MRQYGKLEVFHFDPYSTALSKIERATAEDFIDVLALLEHNWIQIEVLEEAFHEIFPVMPPRV